MTGSFSDSQKSLASGSERQSRMEMLENWRAGPLTGFVRQMREETERGDKIPFFDPCDGGVAARCLFLLEAPGRKAVESGFVSRNNPDESAKNFIELSQQAGIPRSCTAIWNIVPWYIGTGDKIRPAKRPDLEEGLWYLDRVFQLLPSLQVVVMMGQKATFAESHIMSMNRRFEIVRSPHPSPLYVNNRPGNRSRILEVFNDVALRVQKINVNEAGRAVSWVPIQGAQHLSDYDDIVWISVSLIDASWQKDSNYIGRGDTGAAISGRYEKIGDRFLQREPMWMAMTSLDHRGEIAFTDGRHRFAWLRDHGADALPVQVRPDQARVIAARFGTTVRHTTFGL
jgi:uracil-DNA glycosylase